MPSLSKVIHSRLQFISEDKTSNVTKFVCHISPFSIIRIVSIIERASIVSDVLSDRARGLVSFRGIHDKVGGSLLTSAYAHSFLLQNS